MGRRWPDRPGQRCTALSLAPPADPSARLDRPHRHQRPPRIPATTLDRPAAQTETAHPLHPRPAVSQLSANDLTGLPGSDVCRRLRRAQEGSGGNRVGAGGSVGHRARHELRSGSRPTSTLSPTSRRGARSTSRPSPSGPSGGWRCEELNELVGVDVATSGDLAAAVAAEQDNDGLRRLSNRHRGRCGLRRRQRPRERSRGVAQAVSVASTGWGSAPRVPAQAPCGRAGRQRRRTTHRPALDST